MSLSDSKYKALAVIAAQLFEQWREATGDGIKGWPLLDTDGQRERWETAAKECRIRAHQNYDAVTGVSVLEDVE